MSKAVKFMNTECLARAYTLVSEAEFDRVPSAPALEKYIRHRLERLLGEEAGKKLNLAWTNRKDESGAYREYSAELYMLSPQEMRDLYDMIKSEVTQDLKKQWSK